ncbi:MAG: hypothetical protein FWB96_07270 [Defluviitaleaceae bacterium]|nr:hypothetical protein [Defluviitaleaceae bacterium]MCL2262456.1 hypothetical protein [Defluviitaleaceae bacterium]
MIKHMFAGAITPNGFVDFFSHIMPAEKAKTRYLLKGSSGSGKSTFMKKIAAEFEAAGIATEHFHCSNDPESLDALAVPQNGLCITDATAPHSHDPQFPAVIDKIIDFANFLDAQKLAPHLNELKSLTHAKKLQNEKTAAYLAAAGILYLAENKASDSATEKHHLHEHVTEWLKRLSIHNTFEPFGTDRKLFLSAVTPDGYVNFAADYFADCKLQCLFQKFGTASHCFLAELKNRVNAAGFNTESFHNPIAPERLDYLHLPQLKIAFSATTGNLPSAEPFNAVLSAAINSMRQSKIHHAKLEEIYANAMDFNGVERIVI